MAGKKTVKEFYVSDNLGKIFQVMRVVRLDDKVNAGDVNFTALIEEEVLVIRRAKSSSAALAYLREGKPPKVIYVAHWPYAPHEGLPCVEQFEPIVSVSRPFELPIEEMERMAQLQLDDFLSSYEPDW